MRIIILVFLITFGLKGSLAQYIVEGKVVSKADKKPVPFASVYLERAMIGVYSDDSGRFKIALPDSISTDTLVIEHLSFNTERYHIKQVTGRANSFELIPVAFKLEEVNVSAQKGVVLHPGKIKKKVGGYHFGSTNSYFQVARWIPLDHLEGKNVRLKSVHYFVTGKGKPMAPFRVRLYARDTSTGKPGADLITSQVVIQADKKNTWVTASLDTMNIFLPTDGVFAAMEWLPIYDQYEYEQEDGIACKKCYGQVLGLTQMVKEHQHWTKSNLSDWWQLIHPTIIVTPMIYIEVEVFD